MLFAAAAAVFLPVALILLLPLLSEVTSLVLPPGGARRAGRGRRGPRTVWRPGGSPQSRLAFLVPAHDEELLIEACVRSLLAQSSVRAKTTVFVIADNCTDQTARIARDAGATVLERRDPAHPGKPPAIEWALEILPLARFDAVVIIDADSVVDPGFADAVAGHAPLRNKAVQAYFGVSNEQDSWLSRLGGLLGRIRYEGQYRLKARAGLNCPLTGNGMCLGVELLERVGWAPDSLTENWELYARYTMLGEAIEFSPSARLGSQEARTLAQSAPQRRRWQAGRWSVTREYWSRILRSDAIGGRQKLDALAELAVPGPILHATLAGGAALLLLGAPGTLTTIVGTLFALSLLPLFVRTLIAWARHPQPWGIAVAFAGLPVYAVWRLVIAVLSIATGRKRVWLRSPRHSAETA
jgi:1,2-diacylglycerol 3-beta-glucosyltransferase